LKANKINNILICFALLASSLIALGLTPRLKMAEQRQKKVVFEDIIPKQFNDWKIDVTTSQGFINPQVGSELAEIYSQTLSRTYINSNEDRVMLSIAYGDNQSRKLQVHRPEVCYSAQGFQIESMIKKEIRTQNGNIPVMQLIARQGTRNEPITYWVLIGDRVVRGNLEQGVTRLMYGLSGFVPDGLLFRTSTISADSKHAYGIQTAFIRELMASISSSDRATLAGLPR